MSSLPDFFSDDDEIRAFNVRFGSETITAVNTQSDTAGMSDETVAQSLVRSGAAPSVTAPLNTLNTITTASQDAKPRSVPPHLRAGAAAKKTPKTVATASHDAKLTATPLRGRLGNGIPLPESSATHNPPIKPTQEADIAVIEHRLKHAVRFTAEYRCLQVWWAPRDTVHVPDSVHDLRIWRPDGPFPKAGKLNPAKYSSLPSFDLGLCAAVFGTEGACELGSNCPYRHDGLTEAEEDWVKYLGGQHQRMMSEHWVLPGPPATPTRWNLA